MRSKRFKIIKWLILPILALAVFGLINILSYYPGVVERFYSQGFYPVVASLVSGVSKWVAFSLDDVFYFLLISAGIGIIALLILRKLSLKAASLLALNSIAAGYVLFYILWGFNYFREDVNSRLGIEARKANEEEFMKVFRTIAEATNKTYTSFDNFNKEETARLIEDSYRRLSPVLKLDYPAGSRRAKNITLSGFFAQAGISGYFGPFFNEVHINSKLLPEEYPFVLAHEKAHQFGITGEAEANFYAWLVCSNSNSDILKYSANLVALRYFLNHGYGLEGFRDVVAGIDEGVIRDIRKIQEHWLKLRNENVEAVAAKVNDAYLKTNRVEKGIEDYTGVVKHIMEFALDSAFQTRIGY